MVDRWEGLGGLGKGIKKYKLVVRNSDGYIKYNIGNIVNNYNNYDARWVPQLLGKTLCKLYKCLTAMLYT